MDSVDRIPNFSSVFWKSTLKRNKFAFLKTTAPHLKFCPVPFRLSRKILHPDMNVFLLPATILVNPSGSSHRKAIFPRQSILPKKSTEWWAGLTCWILPDTVTTDTAMAFPILPCCTALTVRRLSWKNV